jgi:hypothetical protein
MSYYVYALLDSRKPGIFSYLLPEGGTLSFDHEPIYIGKGSGKRVKEHVPKALNGSDKTRKAIKIRKIYRDGGEVIKAHVRDFEVESDAYSYENFLVGLIGRADFDEGPLTNGMDGGLGGLRKTEESLSKIREGQKRWWASLSEEEKENFSQTVRLKVLNQDPIRKEASRKRRQESAKEWYNALEDTAKQEMKRKQDEAKANKRLVCCPWCGLAGAQSRNMAQYHFDNCEHYGVLVSNPDPWKPVGRYKNSAVISVPEEFIGKHKTDVPEEWRFLWERIDKATPEMLLLWT